MNQKGFTLIELIVIIVILGILAVTAVPKYVDMKTEAEKAAADGVYGAAQGAVTMNYAASLLDIPAADRPAYDGSGCSDGFIDDEQCLANAMEEVPEGWAVTTDYLCRSSDGNTCDAVNTDPDYGISVATSETATRKAVLSRTW
ncbi:MAG: prepilin-type N-terminal cleavage/methylation domain-containing protein [Desulfurivibrionaceae bacterium]|nr:prepilin-type N-terminal cleavage/methylation domain-containing protein [Desulfurivibrionaceae bacterium]